MSCGRLSGIVPTHAGSVDRSHPTRLVIAVARGDLRLLDIEHYLDGVVTANALAYRKIFDMTQATPNPQR